MGINKLLFGTALGMGAILLAKAIQRNSRKYDFHDKVVVITGASRGLGLVMARQLAAEGAQLALCARDEDKLEVVKKELQDKGARVFAMICDVTREEQIQIFIETVLEKYGRIDVLINNAGTDIVGPLESTTVDDYNDMINTHFWGPLHTSLKVIPHMKQREEGRIVNISSIGGKLTLPHMLPYNASKHALVGLSDGLRAELKKDNIYVTTVCPGFIRTGTHHNINFKGKNEEEYKWFSMVISNPLTSMNAEVAARKIIDACRYGVAELVMPFYAKALSVVRNIDAESTSNFASFVDRLMPDYGGVGTERRKSQESYSETSPSFLTKLGDEAAIRNNQFS